MARMMHPRINLTQLMSEYKLLAKQISQVDPTFDPAAASVKNESDACRLLLRKLNEMFVKFNEAQNTMERGGSGTNKPGSLYMKALQENAELIKRVAVSEKVISKLNQENDYYTQHIDNLLDQVSILKGDKKLPKPSDIMLKNSSLEEQLYYKDQQIKQLEGQLTDLAENPNAQYDLEYWKSRANSFEKMYNNLVSQEMTAPPPTRTVAPGKDTDMHQALTMQASTIEKLVQEVESASPKRSDLPASPKSDIFLKRHEEISDLIYGREVEQGALLWEELEFEPLEGETWQSNFVLLRDVMRYTRESNPSQDQIDEMIGEMDRLQDRLNDLEEENQGLLDQLRGQTSNDNAYKRQVQELQDQLEGLSKSNKALVAENYSKS